jgi:hypothetical protein
MDQCMEVELASLVLALKGAGQCVEGGKEQDDPEQCVPQRHPQTPFHSQVGHIDRAHHIEEHTPPGSPLTKVKGNLQAEYGEDLGSTHGTKVPVPFGQRFCFTFFTATALDLNTI